MVMVMMVAVVMVTVTVLMVVMVMVVMAMVVVTVTVMEGQDKKCCSPEASQAPRGRRSPGMRRCLFPTGHFVF